MFLFKVFFFTDIVIQRTSVPSSEVSLVAISLYFGSFQNQFHFELHGMKNTLMFDSFYKVERFTSSYTTSLIFLPVVFSFLSLCLLYYLAVQINLVQIISQPIPHLTFVTCLTISSHHCTT